MQSRGEEIEKVRDEGLEQTYHFSVFGAHAMHTSELDGQEMDKQGEIIASQLSTVLGEKEIAEGQKKCFPHHVAIKSSQELEL